MTAVIKKKRKINMPSAGLDGLISKHAGGAAREQIGQPDYGGPAPFTGPLGSEQLFRRRGEDIQSPCITSLCFHSTLQGSVWGDGWGWGLVQNERRRRLSPAQPCVRQRHSNGNQPTGLYPFMSTCTLPQTPAIAARILLGWLLTGSSSA